MWKIVLDLIGLVILFIILIYLISTPKKSVFRLYRGDKSDLNALKKFLDIPLKKAMFRKLKWEYLVTGKGDQHIIFFHDMGGAYHFWYRQIKELENDYRIITFSYPPVADLQQKIDVVLHLMKIENIQQAHLIGTSLGGYVAQYMAAHHPEKVLSMVLGNTFSPNNLITKKYKFSSVAGPLLPDWMLWKFYRRKVKKKIVFSGENNEELRALLLEQSYQGMSKKQFISRYQCVIESFEAGDMEKFDIPVQIIESDNDPMVTADLREALKNQYPEAQVFTFQGKGHYPFINEHTSYTKIIKEFLNSVNGSSDDSGSSNE